MKHSSSMSSIPFPSLKKSRRALPHSLSLPTFSSLVFDFDASSTSASSSSTPPSPTSPKRPSPLRQTSLPEGDFASSGPLPRIEESRREETENLWFWRKVLSKNEGLRSSRRRTNKPVGSSSEDPVSPSRLSPSPFSHLKGLRLTSRSPFRVPVLDLPVWGTRGGPLPSSTSPRKGSLPLPSSPPPREVRVKEEWEIGIEERIRRYRGSV